MRGDLDYLRKLVPVLRPGGLFVTHNMELATPLRGEVRIVAEPWR